MPATHIGNEVALKQIMVATETVPGTQETPTQKLLGDFTANPGVGTIIRSEDATGGYDRTSSLRRQVADPSGSYEEDATFESLAHLMQWSVQGGVAGVGDSETTEGFTYEFSPSFAEDDIDTFTAFYGVEGLPFEALGVRFDEWNIAGDATQGNAVWTFSGTPFLTTVQKLAGTTHTATGGSTTTAEDSGESWTPDALIGQYVYLDYGTHIGPVRQITDNDATSVTFAPALGGAVSASDIFYIAPALPSLSDPDFESIDMEGTVLYLDPYNASASNLGTTDISERILSFNVTQRLNFARKRRLPGVITRVGRGAREISGSIRFELDRYDEWDALIGNDELSLRIEKEGSVIDSGAGTNKLARIDIERIGFDSWSEDADNNNMTVTLNFVALLESPILTVTCILNEVSSLA